MIARHRRSLQNFPSFVPARFHSRPRPVHRGLPQLKEMIGISQVLARREIPPLRLSRLGRVSRQKVTVKELKQCVEDLIDSCNRSLSRSPSLSRQTSFTPVSDYRTPRKLLRYQDVKRILRDDESKTLRISTSRKAYGSV